MAQSHIKLQGGLGDGRSIRGTITQSNHGFSAGQALRFNRKTATGSGDNKYYAAIADSTVNSEVVGVVESSTEDTFDLVYGGELSLAGACGGVYGFGDDDVFFLSGKTAGLLTPTPPTEAGAVIKPVLVRIGGAGKEEVGIVTNYIGTVIGGTSTVSLNSIQPVGTIEPFAGTAIDVPESWSLCDGGPLDVNTYSELYTRVGNHYGYHVKMTNAGLIGADVSVGMRVKQGTNISGLITSFNSGAGEIEVDVDHLEINSDGTYNPHNRSFSAGLGASTIDIPTGDSPAAATDTTGSIQVQTGGPAASIQLTAVDTTITTVNFRKPDLRGKFVMGVASSADTSTAIATPVDFERGQYGGQYEVSSVSGTGTIASGSDGAVDNIPPYQAFNYLIKVSSTGKAALLDNIVAGFGFSDLVDVDAPTANASSGDVIIYDASSANGAKYKPFRLFTDYPDNQIAQITVDNTSTGNNIINFGNTSQSNAFTVDVSGIRSSDSSAKFVVRDGAGSSDILTVQKNTVGGAVGIQSSPDNSAALKLGSKGLLFSSGSNSTPIIGVDSTVGNPGTHNKLVTEAAVRTAITSATSGLFTLSDIEDHVRIDSETNVNMVLGRFYTINKRAVDGNGDAAPQPPTVMNLQGGKAIGYCVISTGDGGGGFYSSMIGSVSKFHTTNFTIPASGIWYPNGSGQSGNVGASWSGIVGWCLRIE